MRRDLTQGELLQSLKSRGINYSDERLVREWETGEKRPARKAIVVLLAQIHELEDVGYITSILESFGFGGLSANETRSYGLNPETATPVPQQVRWKSGRGGGAVGIEIQSARGNSFLPWPELKLDLENKLLHYLGRHLPEGRYTVDTAPGQGTANWHIVIHNAERKAVGHVWIGARPEKGMVWDGLIRVGDGEVPDGTARTWEEFERWSDGSYRRVGMFDASRDSGR